MQSALININKNLRALNISDKGGNESNFQLQNQISCQDEQIIFESRNIYITWDNIHLQENVMVKNKTCQD